jgi:amino acid transporter
MKIEEENGSKVIRRLREYKPPPSIRTWLIGRPLPTADAPHQTIGKAIGLAVFASDALSSTAYATQEILFILAVAGTAAFGYAFPISIAIVTLLVIVALSYEQTVHAYPGGGGAYTVSRDNLGELPAQIAGSALLTDYILTVAVSISAGVAQIVSAFPGSFPASGASLSSFGTLCYAGKFTGVKESGYLFAIPTYFFILTMFLSVGFGLYRAATGTLGTVIDPPELEILHTITLVGPFLILHAFSSGTAALTGIEAISNGITAFKEPRSRNAGITLIVMAAILGSLFLSITFLAGRIDAIPSEAETVISQLAQDDIRRAGILISGCYRRYHRYPDHGDPIPALQTFHA